MIHAFLRYSGTFLCCAHGFLSSLVLLRVMAFSILFLCDSVLVSVFRSCFQVPRPPTPSCIAMRVVDRANLMEDAWAAVGVLPRPTPSDVVGRARAMHCCCEGRGEKSHDVYASVSCLVRWVVVDCMFEVEMFCYELTVTTIPVQSYVVCC